MRKPKADWAGALNESASKEERAASSAPSALRWSRPSGATGSGSPRALEICNGTRDASGAPLVSEVPAAMRKAKAEPPSVALAAGSPSVAASPGPPLSRTPSLAAAWDEVAERKGKADAADAVSAVVAGALHGFSSCCGTAGAETASDKATTAECSSSAFNCSLISSICTCTANCTCRLRFA